MTIEVRRWRRGLAKAARRRVRAVRNFRPSPVVGALLLGAVLGSGAATGVAIGVADASHGDSSTSQAQVREPAERAQGHELPGGFGDEWGHGGPRH